MDKIIILNWLSRGNKQWYERDIDYSLAFMNSFPYPKDSWQRSYYQFLCYRYDVPIWKRLLYSTIAAFLILPSLIFLRIAHLGVRFISHEVCVGDCASCLNVVPDSLLKKYHINTESYNAGYGLSHSDFLYLINHIYRYLYSPSFILHVTFKIAAYSNIISKYRPEVIICHNEYSYSSSALTDFCRYHHVLHINFMHGERLINIRNAFAEYDKFYVWHEHYKKLYLDLRSGTRPDDFIIEYPKALRINVKEYFSHKEFANYKYYLAKVTYEEMLNIVQTMNVFKQMGYSIKLRPHPRYTDVELLRSVVPLEEIEDPQKVKIETSVASCDYAVGSFSTVLLQAFLCAKGVLLNDVTYGKKRIELQKKARHILLSVEGPELLSSHIAKISHQPI